MELRRLKAELKRVTEERDILKAVITLGSPSQKAGVRLMTVWSPATRQQARSDVFSYIEMFYNPMRRHSSAHGLSPIEFERRNPVRFEAV